METNKKKGGLTGIYAVAAVIAILIASTFSMIRNSLNLGLDLQGGFEILYQVSPLNENQDLDMTAVINSIQKRVDVLGVNEPEITVEGTDRVRVQLAGVADQETAREMLGTTANLTFRDINDELLSDSSIVQEGGASLAYQDGRPIVSLKIADASKFGEITSKVSSMTNGENIMIIWLDWEEGDTYKAELQKSIQGEEPKYISAASVRNEISGDCIIQGNFTEAEARTLANLINSGSLPVKMTEISSNVVSAQYGSDALRTTALAGLLGVLAVICFMIYQYRVPGIIAGIMLLAYIWAIFGTYALMGAVFTLPGIGALVLVGRSRFVYIILQILRGIRLKRGDIVGLSRGDAVSEGFSILPYVSRRHTVASYVHKLILLVFRSDRVKESAQLSQLGKSEQLQDHIQLAPSFLAKVGAECIQQTDAVFRFRFAAKQP
jgi:SecD/SecF fusion protein